MFQDEINQNLRVTFVDSVLGSHIPSIYCDVLFSDEIAAEKSGESESNFYTKTYGPDSIDERIYRWICPFL